jgi:hypothetical protein
VKRPFSAACAVAALLVASASPSFADPIQTSLTLSVNPLTGEHVSGGDIDRVDFAPLPLAEIESRWHGTSIHVEGLPSVTFGYGSNPDGAQSTRLSIVNATVRQSIGAGWFVGVGQTIYNQRTDYGEQSGYRYYAYGLAATYIYGDEIQDSRVTGLRLEVGREVHWGATSLAFDAAFNPAMHGVQYTEFANLSLPDPEAAAQTDLSLRIGHRLSRHGELFYGLRYLNYTAHYVAPGNPLSDRNVGFAPTIAYRLRL